MKDSILTGIFCLMVLPSCQPEAPTAPPETSGVISVPNESQWLSKTLLELNTNGLLKPNVNAIGDGEEIYVSFIDATDLPDQYAVKQLVWNKTLSQIDGSLEVIQTIDNTGDIAAALNTSGQPQLAYQGGNVRQCQENEQSDLMLAEKYTDWQENTAAIGKVLRNPAFSDGLAGGNIAMTSDDFGNTHILYQFFYEGCDGNAFAYPDLNYVKIPQGTATSLHPEEAVDGNTYLDSSIQSAAGDYSEIVIDSSGNPLVVYSARDNNVDKTGLKFATKENGEWINHWIDSECTVEGISAAMSPNNTLSVAYYVSQCGDETYSPALKYARYSNNTWQTETISTLNIMGKYPSLEFNKSGQPFIASYEEKTHQGHELGNLVVSSQVLGKWKHERVIEKKEFGQYNNLWFDLNDELHLVSYSNKTHEISLFQLR